MTLRLRTAIRAVFPLASILVAARASHAQLEESARIAVGAPVWLRTRDAGEGAWRFGRASSESLTVWRRERTADEVLSLPWREMERVDTMAIAPPSARRILLGSAIGGLVGLAVSHAGASLAPCDWDGGDCPAFGFIILAPAIIGTGIVTGGAVGYHHRNWHWSTVWRAPETPPPRSR